MPVGNWLHAAQKKMSGVRPLERRSVVAPDSGAGAAEPHLDTVEDMAMSEFVYLFRASEGEQREAMGTPERAQQSMQAWLAWIRELEANGHLKNPGQPLEPAGKVVRGKKRIVTDGPYVEAKDLVLGFIVIEARDLAQAVELANGCPMLEGAGSVEVRPVTKSPF
jgi:hypothetical protein